jgi:hypothetical protein
MSTNGSDMHTVFELVLFDLVPSGSHKSIEVLREGLRVAADQLGFDCRLD